MIKSGCHNTRRARQKKVDDMKVETFLPVCYDAAFSASRGDRELLNVFADIGKPSALLAHLDVPERHDVFLTGWWWTGEGEVRFAFAGNLNGFMRLVRAARDRDEIAMDPRFNLGKNAEPYLLRQIRDWGRRSRLNSLRKALFRRRERAHLQKMSAEERQLYDQAIAQLSRCWNH